MIPYNWDVEYYVLSTQNGTERSNTNPDQTHKVGDPINPINGAVTQDGVDFSIPAPGLALAFGRAYNSTLNYTGPLGSRWTHTYNWTLTPTNVTLSSWADSFRVVQNDSGEQWVYPVIATNVFGSTFDNATQLIFTNSAYNLIFPGGVTYNFNTNGVLQSIADAWSNRISLVYTNVSGTNLLLSATHSDGQALNFSYQGCLLTNVATPSASLSEAFFYNSQGELTNAVLKTSAGIYPTSYSYDCTTISATNYYNHSMTQKVNAVGDVYAWQYATNADGTTSSMGVHVVVGAGYYDTWLAYNANGSSYTQVETMRGTNTIFNDYWFDPEELRITAIIGPGTTTNNSETAGTGVTYGLDDFGNVASERQYDNTQGVSITCQNQFDTFHNLTNTAVAYCATPGKFFAFGWDTNWNVLTSMTDPEGHLCTLQYTNGALTKASVFYATGSSYDTCFYRATNSLILAITNANGHGVSFQYDSHGNPTFVQPQLGPTNLLAWDALGHLTNVTLSSSAWPSPRTISLNPDELDRNRKTVWPDGSSETFGWDGVGNLTNYVDRGGRMTTLAWLPTHKLASQTRYLTTGATTQAVTIGVSHDQQFNTLQVTDELGRSVESYQLDLQDRPVAISNVESQQMTVAWLLGDYVGSITRFDGTTNSFTYNSDALLQTSAFPDDSNNFTYYKNGMLKTAANNWGAISNTINAANQLIATTSSVPNSAVNYVYFPAGQVSNITSAAGTDSFVLDAADRILVQNISRANAKADTVVYNYNPDNGKLAGLAYSNGLSFARSFDVCDRPKSLTWKNVSNSVLVSRSYTYNTAGIIAQETFETGESANYGYDSLDRLTQETHLDPAGETFSATTYGYDLAGNRTNKMVYGSGQTLLATVNYVFGPGNRLASWSVAQTNCLGQVDVAGYSSKPIGTDNRLGVLSVSSGNIQMTPQVSGNTFAAYNMPMGPGTQQVVAAIRDQAGNMGFATNTIFMTVVTNGTYLYNTAGCLTNIQYSGVQYSQTVALSWNGQYQLTAVATNGVAAERYGFDALGRRVWIWDGTATNYLIYNGAHVIAEVDATGGLKRAYAYGPGIDNPISMAVYPGGATSAPSVYYFLKDIRNSVLALTDTNGNIVETYRYDAWGRTTVYDAGGNTLTKSAVGNRICFQGREYSWVTGLYYYRARWMDPLTGRFISTDPIGISGGLNQYMAFNDNPIMFTDPTGLTNQIGDFPDSYMFSVPPGFSSSALHIRAITQADIENVIRSTYAKLKEHECDNQGYSSRWEWQKHFDTALKTAYGTGWLNLDGHLSYHDEVNYIGEGMFDEYFGFPTALKVYAWQRVQYNQWPSANTMYWYEYGRSATRGHK